MLESEEIYWIRQQKKQVVSKDIVMRLREEEYSSTIKGPLLKQTILIFLMVCYFVFQRIFQQSLQQVELEWIQSIQYYFSVNEGGYTHSILQSLQYMQQPSEQLMIQSHFYYILYVSVDAIICLKVYIVHSVIMFCISCLELLYQDPRPYWIQQEIYSAYCDRSYGNPSSYIFNVLFLIYYTKYCWKEKNEQDYERNKFATTLINISGLLFSLVYGFLLILSGQTFINVIITTYFFFWIFFSFVTFWDDQLNTLFLKSIFLKETAKRFVFFWVIAIILMQIGATFIYLSTTDFVDIDWLQNYLNCLKNKNLVFSGIKSGNLIGNWVSYLRTSHIFGILGALFGGIQAFKKLNIFWFQSEQNPLHSIYRGVLANIFLLLFWLLKYILDKLKQLLNPIEINLLYIESLTSFTIYYFGFGILPVYIYDKLKWTNANLPPDFDLSDIDEDDIFKNERSSSDSESDKED